MAMTLNILIAEDSPKDAELMVAQLRHDGYDPQWRRVETEADFLAELKKLPDIVLSDYSMPQFSGLRAAQLTLESGLNVPFILISGTVGEDAAVEAMKCGATDYLLKDRIVRLGSAVRRALEQKRLRDENKQAEESLRRSREEFKDLFDNAPVGFHEVDTKGRIVRINNTELKMLGYTAEELLEQFVWKISTDEEQSRRAALSKLAGETVPPSEGFERVLRRKDGSTFSVLIKDRLLEREDGSIAGIRAAIQDITDRKKAEEALKYERDLLRTLLDNSPDYIYFKDTQSRFVKCSKTHARFFGVESPDKLAGKTDFDYYTEAEARPRYEDEQKIIHTGQTVIDKEEREERKTGEVRWVSSTKMPWFDNTGKIIGIIGISRDITGRKEAEEKAAQSQERFKLIFESIPVGVALARQYPDGRFERVINNAHLRICGLTREQDQIPGIYLKITHPEDATRQAELGRPFNNGRVGQLAMEKRYLRLDGTMVWVVFTFRRQHRADGSIEELTTVVDITERKQAEESLRQSEAQLQEAQRIASMGSYALDIASGHWSSSPALDDLFGIDASYERSVAGWTALVHPDDRAMMVDHFEKEVLGQQRPFNKEYRIVRHNDQTEHWVHDMGKLEFDAAGRPVKMFGTIQDITARRKLEEQFRQAQKMEGIGQLAGGVAHDFNNILAVIQMQADLLKTGAGIAPAQLELVSGIANAAQRAANLTRQLLMFSRKQTLQLRDLDFNEVVNDMAKMLRRTLGEDVQLQFKFAMQPLFIRGDAGMLDQVLLNLAVNARDAMPKGGQLVIETSAVEFDESVREKSPQARPGSFACLSVSDTGSGIPPEILSHIFEPFFTTKEVGKGTGLGLATVHGIVQQHQGWINIYSEAGHGTTFRIYLPRLAGMSGQKPEPSDLTAVRGGNETLLLVEDEKFLRELAAKVLSQLGYRVLEAANGNEALEIWKQHRDEIKLLLTDLVMPGGMTGMDLGGRLLKENPKLKVIYTSGYSAEIAGKDCPVEEGVDFLTKPFASRKLAQTVRNSMDNI